MTKVKCHQTDNHDCKEKQSNLDLIDELLKRMYQTLIVELGESVKIGDFIKMIELRRKLSPEKQSEQELWKLLEKVRSEVLGGKCVKHKIDTVSTKSTQLEKKKGSGKKVAISKIRKAKASK